MQKTEPRIPADYDQPDLRGRFGPYGGVYVADCDGKRVLEYAPKSTKEVRTINLPGCPNGLAIDPSNNLYVGYTVPYSYASQVEKFRAGATRGTALLPPKTVRFIGSVAIDRHGNLVVANEGDGAIDVFSRPKQPPSAVIKTGQTLPFRFAFDHSQNRIYITSPYLQDARRAPPSGPKLANTVVVLDYPSGNRLSVFRQKGWIPTGIAIGSP